MSRIFRVIDGDSKPVGVSWERVSKYDNALGEPFSVMYEAENRASDTWKSGQVIGIISRSHGEMLLLPDRRQVTLADLRRMRFTEVMLKRETSIIAGGGEHD